MIILSSKIILSTYLKKSVLSNYILYIKSVLSVKIKICYFKIEPSTIIFLNFSHSTVLVKPKIILYLNYLTYLEANFSTFYKFPESNFESKVISINSVKYIKYPIPSVSLIYCIWSNKVQIYEKQSQLSSSLQKVKEEEESKKGKYSE